MSIPPDTLVNTPLEVGDPANIFTVPERDEIVITADTRRWLDQSATPRGSRKVRQSSHGTVLVSIPPECLTDDLGFQTPEAATEEKVSVTVDAKSGDLFVEF